MAGPVSAVGFSCADCLMRRALLSQVQPCTTVNTETHALSRKTRPQNTSSHSSILSPPRPHLYTGADAWLERWLRPSC